MNHQYLKQITGYLYVICGPMFAGKSEELLRYLNSLKYAKIEYKVFKAKIDVRQIECIKSRDGRILPAIEINSPWEIYDHLVDIKTRPFCVAFDELHFFSKDIVEVIKTLIKSNFYIIASGLATDYNNNPFGPMGDCLAIADEVKKLTAICLKCGSSASKTNRLVLEGPQILVGDVENYEASCTKCHVTNEKNSDFSEATQKFLKKHAF